MNNEKKVTGILVDVKTNRIQETTINDTLEDLRNVIDCLVIEITDRNIDGECFTIVCDDNALGINPVPRGSIFNRNTKVEVCGNAFICKTDCMGNLKSLSQEEINKVMAHQCVGTLISKDSNVPAKIINFIEVD